MGRSLDVANPVYFLENVVLTDPVAPEVRVARLGDELLHLVLSPPASRSDYGARTELVEAAREDRAAAAEAGYPFRPHSFSGEWKVVADVPGWLSLSGAAPRAWAAPGGDAPRVTCAAAFGYSS